MWMLEIKSEFRDSFSLRMLAIMPHDISTFHLSSSYTSICNAERFHLRTPPEVSTITTKANFFSHITWFESDCNYNLRRCSIHSNSNVLLIEVSHTHVFLLLQIHIDRNTSGRFQETTMLDVVCCQLVNFIFRSGVSFILLKNMKPEN